MIGSIVPEIMNKVYLNYWKETECQRVKEAQELYYWYFNEQSVIKAFIKKALYKTFLPKTVKKLNIRVFNIVSRVVDKLALVYKEPATRVVKLEQRQEVNTEEIKSEVEIRYENLLKNSDIDSKSRQWHSLGKLFNTVLVQPIWVSDDTLPEGGKINYTIHTPAFSNVVEEEDNYLKPRAFYYATYRIVKGVEQQVLIYWSKEKHFYIDTFGNEIAIEGNENKENPYKILPIVVLRFKEGNDFWGNGLWDLVNGNEEVCVQVTNLMYTALFQSFGVPVGINLNLPAEPQISPDKPILVNGVRKDDVPPSFYFAKADAPLQEVRDLIDWLLKTIQVVKGLSPQQFSIERESTSGISKMIDSSDIVETRESDIVILDQFERDLYKVTKQIYNYHVESKPLDEKGIFSVEFSKPKITKTTTEKVQERNAGLGKWISLRDALREDFPNSTEEEIEEKMLEIMNEKNSGSTSSFFRERINNVINRSDNA